MLPTPLSLTLSPEWGEGPEGNRAEAPWLVARMSTTQERSIYEIEMPRLDGQPEKLSDYAGQVILAVNVASKCGFTPQYAGLEAMYEKYSPRGLAILGFPCNQFFGQEPGSAEKIQEFCSLNYGVTFPLFSKIDVKGGKQHPLYAILTSIADDAGKAGNVGWNFEKFLIGRDGRVLRRYPPPTKPDEPALLQDIADAL